MYHDLVDSMTGNPIDLLLQKLKEEGFKYVDGDTSLLTEQEVEEAWEHLKTCSAENAVDFLETVHGFLFERS